MHSMDWFITIEKQFIMAAAMWWHVKLLKFKKKFMKRIIDIFDLCVLNKIKILTEIEEEQSICMEYGIEGLRQRCSNFQTWPFIEELPSYLGICVVAT